MHIIISAQMIHRTVYPESHGWPSWWNSRSTQHSMELNFFQFLPNISLESKVRDYVWKIAQYEVMYDSGPESFWGSTNAGRVAIEFKCLFLMSAHLSSYSTSTSFVFLCHQCSYMCHIMSSCFVSSHPYIYLKTIVLKFFLVNIVRIYYDLLSVLYNSSLLRFDLSFRFTWVLWLNCVHPGGRSTIT